MISKTKSGEIYFGTFAGNSIGIDSGVDRVLQFHPCLTELDQVAGKGRRHVELDFFGLRSGHVGPGNACKKSRNYKLFHTFLPVSYENFGCRLNFRSDLMYALSTTLKSTQNGAFS